MEASNDDMKYMKASVEAYSTGASTKASTKASMDVMEAFAEGKEASTEVNSMQAKG